MVFCCLLVRSSLKSIMYSIYINILLHAIAMHPYVVLFECNIETDHGIQNVSI